MAKEKRRWPVVVLWLLTVVGGAVAAVNIFSPAPPPPEISIVPGESVEIQVDTPETLAKLASLEKYKNLMSSTNGQLRLENKQLRDEQGRLYRVVEVLEAQTKPKHGPTRQELTQELESSPEEPVYTAKFTGLKFLGQSPGDGESKYKLAWKGKIQCWMNDLLLHEGELDYSQTVAVTSTKPEDTTPELETVRQQNWYVGLHYSIITDDLFVDQQYLAPSFSPDKLRVYVGRAWLENKEVSIGTEVFAEANAIGVGLQFRF